VKNFALLPASKEIRGWCSVLEQEMMHWSGVKMSHIFGTRAFYHRKVMFAMPDRRSLDSSTAISFRGPLRGQMKMQVGRHLNSRIPTSLTRHCHCWVRPTGIVSLIHFPKNRSTQGKPLPAPKLRRYSCVIYAYTRGLHAGTSPATFHKTLRVADTC
jgi:hypothetical protein